MSWMYQGPRRPDDLPPRPGAGERQVVRGDPPPWRAPAQETERKAPEEDPDQRSSH